MQKNMIRFIFLAFLFGLLIQTTITAQENDTADNLNDAEALIKAGKKDKALVLLEDIIVKDPTNIEAQEQKINILLQKDMEKDALKDINNYITMYPMHPEYYYLRGLINLQRQKYTKSLDDFNKALQLKMPSQYLYKLYANRGMAKFYLQEYDQANADFNRSISLDRMYAAAYHGKGMVQYDLNDYDSAVIEFRKSLDLEEDNAITHFNLGMAYFRLNDNKNACYHFNRSCALGNRNACRLFMMQCTENIKIPQ